MKWTRSPLLCATFVLLAGTGCGSKEEPAAATPDATPEAVVATGPAVAPGTNTAAQVITTARTLLKAGNVDEAAARLAQLQLQGASFNAQQARDYRQALSEAYDQAIEAAQRGDPRAQTALQLLRAAGPR